MMKLIRILLISTFFLLSAFLSKPAHAQCAMCQATVESNLDGGGTTGLGLNKGIMFLLAAPYLALAGGGLLWYKKYRKKKVDINIPQEKIHLN